MIYGGEYGIELSFSNYADSFLIPVNPDTIEIKESGDGKSYTVAGLGEINVIKAPKLTEISFSGIFPAHRYPFVIVKEDERLEPQHYLEKIRQWRERKRPIRFHAVSSTYVIDMPMSIERFEWKEEAGSPGDIQYQLSLKKYAFYAAKKVTIVPGAGSTGTSSEPEDSVQLQSDEPTRPDEREIPDTYVLRKGEGLWSAAQRVWGDGSRYPEIQEYNGIPDADLRRLPIGLVLKIPGGEADA